MKTYVFFLLVILMTSCATITQGTKEEVLFTTKPDSTEVWISGKMIGYTPTTAEISTFGKKEVTLIYPNGQKTTYVLKKRVSPAVLLNLLLVAPELCLIGFGTDMLSGGGWAFVDKTDNKKFQITEKTAEITTESFRMKPELYGLLSGGISYGKVGESGERKDILSGDLYFETILSLRKILHFGFGGNYGFIKFEKDDNVSYTTFYFIFKGAPRIKEMNKGYILLHLGGGDVYANFEEPEPHSRDYFYIAFGTGMDISESLYAEILIKGFFTKCPKMPTESIGLKVGFRLPDALNK